jgi:hypothetical protein
MSSLIEGVSLAHVNLKEEYLPYKYLIGQILLDVRNALRSASSTNYQLEKHCSSDGGKQVGQHRHPVPVFQNGTTGRRARLRR